ncbi:MAG: hypothetical protein HY563_02515 [Ignavibacteriales bacterium]|nr:hypothetical protein [Ignavibacteriales bacterium]
MDNGLFSGYLLAEAPSWKAIVGGLHIETGQQILLGRRNPVVSVPHEPVRRAAHSAIFGYRSSDEIGLLGGAALEVRLFKTVTLATFYSNKAVHGTVSDDGQFSPVSGAGLFRTATELAKRNRSRERVLGTVVSLGSERWLVSAAAYHTRYLHRVLPKGRDSDEGTREFAGVSLSGWLALTNATMSAEFACQKNRATGFSAGIVIEPADVCCVGVSGTMFSSGYDRMLAGRRTPEQEVGLHGTAELRPAKNWKLQGESSFTEYADRWPGEVVRRSHVESSIALSRRTQVTLRCSVRESPGKAQTMTADGLVRLIQSSQKRRHIVMSFVTGKGGPLQWTARIDYVVFRYPSGSRTSGLGISQHCRWIASPGLSVEGKITLFGTDSYEERFFSFEPEVPGTFSSRQVFGRGSRSALLVRFRPFTVLELSCSYAVEIKDGARVLGSGMDEISGDMHGVVTIQIDARL